MNDRAATTRGERDGVVDLLRETADGLGRLIAEHVSLAKLELLADVRRVGRRLRLILLAVPFLVLGYGMLWLAAAVALGRVIGLARALLVVGALHMVVGVAALAVGLTKRRRRPPLMGETASEVSRTLATIKAQAGASG